mmetsp:Transcript_43647/g.102967  ORF Transcript_43647/g.102967 Transcript_43647/m.102967 type:complete len:120 (-) Transcript_43647:760-1119(-)
MSPATVRRLRPLPLASHCVSNARIVGILSAGTIRNLSWQTTVNAENLLLECLTLCSSSIVKQKMPRGVLQPLVYQHTSTHSLALLAARFAVQGAELRQCWHRGRLSSLGTDDASFGVML